MNRCRVDEKDISELLDQLPLDTVRMILVETVER